MHPTATTQQQQLLLHLSHHQETTPLFKRIAPTAVVLELMDVAGVEVQIVVKESCKLHMGNHFEPFVTSPLTPLPTIRPTRKYIPPPFFSSQCYVHFYRKQKDPRLYLWFIL